MLVVTLSCFGVWGKLQYDWYCKLSLAAKWVEPLVKLPDRAQDMPSSEEPWGPLFAKPPSPPAKVSGKAELELLELAILRLRFPKQRMAGLSILVETRKGEVFPILRDLLAKSTHAEITAALVHLICLQRNAADVPEFVRLLDHRDEAVRAAAADALGYIHLPTYLDPREEYWRERHQSWLNVEPPINIGPLIPSGGEQRREAIDLDSQVRLRLEQMMLNGTSDVERTAAAGVLVNWPPENGRFRFAEWGVWLDEAGELKLAQTVLDEIPPFVHRTGNPLREFRSRVNQNMFITKPVVHITANRAMAIDLEVLITQGRPWYGYPRPDDFALEAGTRYGFFRRDADGKLREAESIGSLESLDRAELGSLKSLHEGYSWRLPKHRSVGASSGSMGAYDNVITSMGLRWQSLIVSPNRETWMAPPEIGDDPRFAWWQSLREVPSSWVSSHGEAERFLYYDGPSFAHSPVFICSDERQLSIRPQQMISPLPNIDFSRTAGEGQPEIVPGPRTAFLIQVGPQGLMTQEFALPESPDEEIAIQYSDGRPRSLDDAIDHFLALLMKAHLTKEEAGGLIASWRRQFFETPGKRLLTIVSREDYDQICPLSIRPTPTATIRVGIVLTELAE